LGHNLTIILGEKNMSKGQIVKKSAKKPPMKTKKEKKAAKRDKKQGISNVVSQQF
jgi:hypothetical protein